MIIDNVPNNVTAQIVPLIYHALSRFHTMVVDGHSVEEILKALAEAQSVKNKPSALICKTFKGQGSSDVADKLDFHG